MFAVRGDSPYHTIADLVGKRIAFGAKGSGIPILGRYMLDGIGLKQDEDFKSFLLDHAKEGPEMVLTGGPMRSGARASAIPAFSISPRARQACASSRLRRKRLLR